MPNVSLVTGGSGFIGSHIVDELINSGNTVVVLDDMSGGFPENVNPAAILVNNSVTDAEVVNSLFSQYKFNHVFHLAAYAAEGLSHFIKRFNYINNLIGSVNVINASINNGVECFVFTSSIAVYGRNQLPMTEDLLPVPEDSYGIAKLAVEHELRVSHDIFGLNYVIFRPHNVYGERQNIGDRYRNVIGIFMNQILHEQPLTIFGDGSQTRAFTYISDVAPIIAKAPITPGAQNQIFNIGADKPVPVKQVAEYVCQEFGVPLSINYLDARKEVEHAYASHEKARRVFGRRSQVPLEDGIHRMAEWVRQMGPRSSNRFDHIEVFRNMPPSWYSAFEERQTT